MLRSHHSSLLLLIAALLTQCRPDVSIEHDLPENGICRDTVDVTSFSTSREISPDLKKWKVYEAGREIITVPPDWRAHLEGQGTQGQDLIIAPPSSADGSGQLVFTRLAKDSSTLDYDKFVQQLANNAFLGFTIQKGDTLKKINLKRDFCYERNVGLLKKGVEYKGYFLAYVNDNCIYKYTIFLPQHESKAYKGDLLRNIIANLQINREYILGNNDPIKNVIYINQ